MLTPPLYPIPTLAWCKNSRHHLLATRPTTLNPAIHTLLGVKSILSLSYHSSSFLFYYFTMYFNSRTHSSVWYRLALRLTSPGLLCSRQSSPAIIFSFFFFFFFSMLLGMACHAPLSSFFAVFGVNSRHLPSVGTSLRHHNFACG